MLERSDIQGIVTSAYARLGHATYLFFEVEDGERARRWLGELTEAVRTADERFRGATTGQNVGLTSSGLEQLGLPRDALRTFPREFRQGMHFVDRAVTLGDVGASAPEHWLFGGTRNRRLDVAVLLFASTRDELGRLVRPYEDESVLAQHGLALVHTLETRMLEGEKEHFGFRDGVAQPLVEGFPGSHVSDDGFPADFTGERRIRAGEFVLGYDNEYGLRPHSPSLASDDDGRGVLHTLPESEGTRRDLGENGSFLVVRQLDQDVAGFWSYCRRVASSDRDARLVAEKMVGRSVEGLPLADPGAGLGPFGYREDLKGHGCPVGAHIRRTNPRDALPGGLEASIIVSRRHRILRRGRPYGPPLDVMTRDDGVQRGLAFLCVNANLRRQFEFIQQAWAANPKFAELADEDDPIIGQRAFTRSVFTMPGEPVRRRVTGLPTFVTLRGGGYFFVPGVRVLRYLASGDALARR